MSLQIKKAVRHQKKIRIDIVGPSGSGKTHTALNLATGLGKKILLIDSEHGRSALFADMFDFDILELPETTIDNYLQAITLGHDYDVVVIDSGSHAWEAINEEVQQEAKKSRGGNSFQAWGSKGNPLYSQFIEELISHPAHVIVTMRVKSDYVMEEYTGSDGKTRTKPVKVGLAPKFREGGEYEFDIIGNIDLEHNLIIEKAPPGLNLDGKVISKPGKELGEQIRTWLDSGAAPVIVPPAPSPLTNGDGGVRKAVREPIPDYPGNPWVHVIQGENSMQGVPLCAVNDNTGEWFNKAFNRKVPNKNLTALDIAALQKILTQDDDHNFQARIDARRELASGIEREQYANVESESEA